MKTLLILTVTSLVIMGCGKQPAMNNYTPSEHSEGVVYGRDSVEELDQDTRVRMNLMSVAAIFDKQNLKNENGKIHFNTSTVADNYNTCSPFKLNKQIGAAHCSGILVGRQVVLTAKHCVNADLTCEGLSVVFGYDAVNVKNGQSSLTQKMVYNCKEVQLDKDKDAARIILDRPVSQVIPLVRRSTPTPERKFVGQKVYSFGFSLGTPIKKSVGVIKSYDEKSGEFKMTLDVFDKNSGSPIFTEDQFFLGILVNGAYDFIDNYEDPYACKPVRKCPEGGCLAADGTQEDTETVLAWWKLPVMSLPGGSSGW